MNGHHWQMEFLPTGPRCEGRCLICFCFKLRAFESYAIALGLTLAASLVGAVNLWQLMRSKNDTAQASVWIAIACFSFATAALAVLGRGYYYPIPSRYSPGSDGFWMSLIALAIMTLARRPPRHLAGLMRRRLRTAVRPLSNIRYTVMVIFSNVSDGAMSKASIIWQRFACLFSLTNHNG
jgi:hypothetical protein